MLFVTDTTLSVPALMGAIMCIGIATANSILIVSFAQRTAGSKVGRDRRGARSRADPFRPVLMTALAMIIGMMPMAFGTGRGRRAERSARARRDRRAAHCHVGHAVLRPHGVQSFASPPWPRAQGGTGFRTDSGSCHLNGRPMCRNKKIRLRNLSRRSGSHARCRDC